jgi:hypothetical protein
MLQATLPLVPIILLNARQSHRIDQVARCASFLDFAVMPAVQHRLVSWRPSFHRRIIG